MSVMKGLTSWKLYPQVSLNKKITFQSWPPVALSYNPSYLGSRDQEDHSSVLAQANSTWDTILEIPNTKKGLAEQLKW
jgi:hypothetical protein